MTRLIATAVVGNVAVPSRTLILAERILSELSALTALDANVIQLADIGDAIGRSSFRDRLPRAAQGALTTVESSQLLVVATPVYRGSYSGIFKHFFDLIEQNALAHVPVVLAATGGSDRHCLMLEHQLRPLFSFFGCHTVPTAVYASNADFSNGVIESENVLDRISRAARQALRLSRVHPLSTREESPLHGTSEPLTPLLHAVS